MRTAPAVVGVLLLAGCGDPVQEQWEDRASLPSCGSVDAGLSLTWREAGPEEWDCFADALAAGEDAELHVIYSTDEGDPIPTWYRLHDGEMTIYEDTTQDAFGAGTWLVTTCQPPAQLGDTIACG